MKFKGFILLSLFLIGSCTTKENASDSLLSYFSKDAAAIIRINDMARFQSELKNNDFLSEWEQLPFFGSMDSFLSGLEYIKSDATCSVAFYEVGKDQFEFLLIAPNISTFFDLEKAAERSSETLSYENHSIEKIMLNGASFFATNLDGNVAVGSSQLLLENLIRVKKTNQQPKVLQKLYETADLGKSANFFVNLNMAESFIAPGLKPEKKGGIGLFSDWFSLDFNTNQDQLHLNGVTVNNDSIKNMVGLFKNATPMADKTAAFAPINSNAILSFSIGDYTNFVKNLDKYHDRLQKTDTILNTVEGVGLIYLNNEKAVVLNSFGINNIMEHLNSIKSGSTEYQGSEIISLAQNDFISKNFNPLVKNFASNFCAILENSFVFTEDRETLQTIISNYKNNATFNQAPVYNSAMQSLANESNILFVAKKSGIDHILENDFLPKSIGGITDKNSYAAQLVADNGFYHTSFLVSKMQKTVATNSVSQLFTLELDTDLATNPKFVKNHRTNKQEIVVQDNDNNLYLISSDGKVLWKKQLEGKVQGDINQVDIYKNGKLQLAFCTNDQFLILDRNGDEVPPFNKKFEGGNLNGLAVFDYERRKDYRFVVTQGDKVFMYNSKGNIVSGFTYTQAESNILKAPEHFRLGKKDFLVFQLENNSLKIKHRAGQDRIKISEKIDFSDNDIFLYKNKFSLTDKSGVLHQIDGAGKLAKTDFNLNKDHGMYATSKTLALMNDNVLSIKGKKVELELGVYTQPKIFYIYDKIYVSVTDLQNQKIFLFDSQAKPISNFPVFGNSLIDLTDMDNDRKLELVAKDQENSIIVYKLN